MRRNRFRPVVDPALETRAMPTAGVLALNGTLSGYKSSPVDGSSPSTEGHYRVVGQVNGLGDVVYGGGYGSDATSSPSTISMIQLHGSGGVVTLEMSQIGSESGSSTITRDLTYRVVGATGAFAGMTGSGGAVMTYTPPPAGSARSMVGSEAFDYGFSLTFVRSVRLSLLANGPASVAVLQPGVASSTVDGDASGQVSAEAVRSGDDVGPTTNPTFDGPGEATITSLGFSSERANLNWGASGSLYSSGTRANLQLVGSITFRGAAGSITIGIDGSRGSVTAGDAGSDASATYEYEGVFVVSGGTGAYAGLVGTGTIELAFGQSFGSESYRIYSINEPIGL